MNATPFYMAPEPIVPERPRVGDAARSAMCKASDDLKRRGALATMVSSLLFCLILTIAWFTVLQLLFIPVEYAALTAAPILITVLEIGVYAVSAVLLIMLVVPAWLGRLRLAGLICTGGTPQVRDVLYFYTSPRRWGRAVQIALVLVLQLAFPVALISGGSVFLVWLYNEELIFAMNDVFAILLVVFGFFLLFVLFLGSILLSGVWTTFTALAVGNDKLPVLHALKIALRTGRARLGTLAVFTLHSLWHLLLSVVTLGILYMYWYSHHYLLSYLRLSMAICSEKE